MRSIGQLTIAATCALALSLTAAGPATAKGNHPSTEGNTNRASILTYDDVVTQLEKTEKTSRYDVDVFTLAEYGTEVSTSEQGRDLYVAKVGDGEQKVWIQGRIHGDEPYGSDATLALLQNLGNNGSGDYDEIRENFTIYFIPMYNVDGSEMNTRTTTLWDETSDSPLLDEDGREQQIDLNRGWKMDGFHADESLAFYEFWTEIQPDFAIDIHHQGLKEMYGTGEDVTLSLGISLAPGGPTLPGIKDGAYDVLTRQMHSYVYQQLSQYGHIAMDRYQVGNGYEIDIKGGVVSAMMLGLNYQNMNSTGHSNPVVFFETSGNLREGNLGQRARGKNIRQNVLAMEELLLGMAGGEVQQMDPELWEEIPHAPVNGYSTDYAGVIPAN